ncbi:MAG: pyridoxamine 5'-phosphate oxidase family protein [Robiginitomaculum sp.]|nr:pyridoxamine 5'-phosphate oxidase family protein [Robiginitomaculum sp.]
MSKQNTQNQSPASERTRVKRGHKRADYSKTTVNEILDAMPLCHVAYTFDGKPVVTPTLQWREGEHVYWHGSAASRLIRKAEGTDVCMAVTLMDGMVLARSAFHHSVNYRSVMLFGKASLIKGEAAKTASLKAMFEQWFPGRWDEMRPMLAKELKATSILSIRIDEASAKVRTGPPVDDEEDYALPIWAGILPVTTSVGKPIDDPKNLQGLMPPASLAKFIIG